MNSAVPIEIGSATATATSAIAHRADEDGGDAELAPVGLPLGGGEERGAAGRERVPGLDEEEEPDAGHHREHGHARPERPPQERTVAAASG